MEGCYKYNHKHFDENFENACLPTNYHIRDHVIDEEDHSFYCKYLSNRVKQQEAKLEKGKKVNCKAAAKKNKDKEEVVPQGTRKKKPAPSPKPAVKAAPEGEFICVTEWEMMSNSDR